MNDDFDTSNYERELLKTASFRQKLAAITALPVTHVIAFSLWCIERLLPALTNVCHSNGGDASLSDVSQVVSRLSAFSDGASIEKREVNRLVMQLEAIDEGEEECCEDWNDGIDALSAISLTLKYCLGQSPMEAALVGQVLLDNVDRKLLNRNLGVSSGPHPPAHIHEINEELSNDPEMLKEVALQMRVLEMLATTKVVTPQVRSALLALTT